MLRFKAEAEAKESAEQARCNEPTMPAELFDMATDEDDVGNADEDEDMLRIMQQCSDAQGANEGVLPDDARKLLGSAAAVIRKQAAAIRGQKLVKKKKATCDAKAGGSKG